MKLLLIANTNSPHTQKWAVGLSKHGIEVHLFSIDPALQNLEWRACLKSHYAPAAKDLFLPRKYFRLLKKLKQVITANSPDIVHAHYLSNYASLAVLSRFHPLVVTAWGSDVFQYPKQNLLNAFLLKWVLRKSNYRISTSEAMKLEMSKYCNKPISVIPFGVDFSAYTAASESHEGIRIAIFKRLEPVYNIDKAILAVHDLTKQAGAGKIELHIYGSGSQELQLKQLSYDLQMGNSIVFHGWFEPKAVPEELVKMDICLYLSERESFGVALIEAMAAQKALVVSNIPAFREVAEHYSAISFVNATNNAEIIAALQTQIKQVQSNIRPDNRRAFERYDLQQNILEQITVYKRLLATKTN